MLMANRLVGFGVGSGLSLSGNSLGTYSSSGLDLGLAAASTMRQHWAASLFVATGTAVRITFIARSAAAMTISNAYIGPKAAAGDAWDLASATRLTFDGGASSSGSFAASATKATDIVAYALDNTKDQIISWETTAGGVSYRTGATANVTLYYKDGAADAATLDATGYTTYTTNTPNSITLFEY